MALCCSVWRNEAQYSLTTIWQCLLIASVACRVWRSVEKRGVPPVGLAWRGITLHSMAQCSKVAIFFYDSVGGNGKSLLHPSRCFAGNAVAWCSVA